MILGVHHTAFSVENLEESIDFYVSLGFTVVNRFEKDEPKAKAAYLEKNAIIEIWQFEYENDPQAKIIKKHVALETNNLEEDIKTFQENGYRIAIPVTQETTIKAFAFLVDKSDNYIELYERS